MLEEECGIRVLTCAHVSPIPGLSELELVGIGDIVSSADFRYGDPSWKVNSSWVGVGGKECFRSETVTAF